MQRKDKARAQTYVYLALVAGSVVVVNAISYGAHKRIDLTASERFTLSKGSQRLVREGLKQDLQIELYVTRGLPKYDVFVQDLIDLMNEYERAGGGKLKYTVIEPKTEEQRTAAKDAGLQEANFGDISETDQDKGTIARGFMGIAFKYGLEKESIPLLTPDNALGLEFWITNKIREIRDRADEVHLRFGVVTGKDEIKLSENNLVASGGGRPGYSMRGVIENALPFYKFEDVDLGGGETEVNGELAGLIVTQPAKDFTEKELKQLDKFLMKGNKAVVVFAGAANLKASDPSLKAELNLRGLDGWLNGYGIEMKKEIVLDWGRPAAVPVATQAGVGFLQISQISDAIHEDGVDDKEQFLDHSFAGFFRIPQLAFPFPSTLVPHPEKQPNAKLKVVARSTERSTVVSGELVDLPVLPPMRPKSGEYGQRAIAIAVEGKLDSAYGAGSGENSRVLVVSSPQFLSNPLARAGNPPQLPPQMAMMGGMGGDENLQMLSQGYASKYLTNTILAFKNTLDWMGGDADLIATSAKILQDPNLTYQDIAKPKQEATDDEASLQRKYESYRGERKQVQSRVEWALRLGPAALIALYGLARWWRKESQRDVKRLA